MKFLVVFFDGLRPDQISEAVTPNLHWLKERGAWGSRHSSSFPSETRVSSAAFATGSHVSGHGIVANKFFSGSEVIDGSSVEALSRLQTLDHNSPMTASSLAQILTNAGRTMLAIGSQSHGSWSLSNWNSWLHKHPGFWVHKADTYCTNLDMLEIARRFPALPIDERPALQAASRVADVFLQYVRRAELADVNLLWFSEPDISFHTYGVGSRDANDVLRKVDAEFGRILEWWDRIGASQRVQLIATSDHGHTTIGQVISVADYYRNLGFRVGSSLDGESDMILLSQRVCNFWVRPGDSGLLDETYAAALEMPWCGPAFSATGVDGEPTIKGTFSYDVVAAQHARSPSLSIVLSECLDAKGTMLADRVYYDGPYRVGAGMHGGLNPQELSATAIFAGDIFEKGENPWPTGIVDLTPTILSLLGVPIPPHVQGRVLSEIIQGHHCDPAVNVSDASVALDRSGRRLSIDRWMVGKHVYLRGVTSHRQQVGLYEGTEKT